MELQRTPEWYMGRCGKITASSMYKVMASKNTAVYKNYLMEIALEQLTNRPTESYTNPAMQWGVDNEPLARMAYELHTGNTLKQVGMIQHETLLVGASPDDEVNEDGLAEYKCPNTATHINTLMTEKVPTEYVYQMQTQMWIDKKVWCDFVSYDPRLIGKAQLFIKRVNRDDAMIAKIEQRCIEFLDEVNQIVKRIEEINGV